MEKKKFIEKLGERYSGNPSVVAVTVSFVNAMTNDWFIPHFIGRIGNTEVNQVEDWLKIGYTHEKMLRVGVETIETWAESFPNQVLKLPLGVTREDLDGSKTRLAEEIISYGYENYPDRFYVQVNALCPNLPSPDELVDIIEGEPLYLLKLLVEHTPNIGLQLLAAASNWYKDDCRLNNREYPCYPRIVLLESIEKALTYDPSYIEYWMEDGGNKRLESIIEYATSAMRDHLAVYIEKPMGFCFFDKQFIPMNLPLVIGDVTIKPVVYPKHVDKVEFYINDNLVYVDTEEPYEYIFNDKPGLYKMRVKIYNDNESTEYENTILHL